MGVIYRMSCERCGSRFDHQAGIGFICTCKECGEVADESAPFFCPSCHKRYQPGESDFEESVVETILWD